MTTHTNLIARLRSGWTTDRLLAADALESLEQQVAALQQGGDAKAVQRMQDLENLVAALTKERDELKISNAFAHGEWRAVKDQLAALTDELNNIKKEAEMNQKWAFLEWRQRAEDAERQVAALTKEKNDWYRLHDHVTDELVSSQAREAKLRDAAKAVLEVGMGSDFEALNAAFAIPADDSALQERLEQERENCADAMWQAYLDGEESYSKLHDVIRSMT